MLQLMWVMTSVFKMFLLLGYVTTSFHVCPVEYSTIFSDQKSAKWTSVQFEYQIVISDPPCYDTNNNLITRICYNGSWYPKMLPQCQKYLENKHNPRPYSASLENSTLPTELSNFFNKSAKDCWLKPSDNYFCYYKSKNCKHLATIRTIDDKKFLDTLAKENLCRLADLNFKDPFLKGLHPYLNNSNWHYGNYVTNCFLCEKSLYLNVNLKLVLHFNAKKKRLILVIYSPEEIIHHKKEISCYTNAGTLTLKQSLKINQIFKKIEADEDFFNSLLVYEVGMKDYLGEYWCEAFTSNLSVKRSEKIIAFKKKRGNEYSLRLVIFNVCKVTCQLEEFLEFLIEKKLKNILRDFDSKIRLMEIFNFDIYKDELDILVHVSTGKNNSIRSEYYQCLSKLENNKNLKVVYFRSSEFCLPEVIILGKKAITWPLTKINNVAVSNEFCLVNNGTPLVRQCQGDFFYGSNWSTISSHCIDNPEISKTTLELHKLSNANPTPAKVVDVVRNANLQVLDIFYLSKILENFSANESLYVLELVNKIMSADQTVLEKSQNLLNLTDLTLQISDYILSNLTVNQNSSYIARTDNLILHVSNPFQSNISGILLYGQDNSHFSNWSILDFYSNDDFEMIQRKDLKFAAYVPEIILEQILNDTENPNSDVFIVTVIFNNDKLFIDNDYHSSSLVISITISGFGSYLKTPIPIIFESKNNSKLCGFWDNGETLNWKRGKWSDLGSNYAFLENNLHKCSYIHLTHFALLLMSDNKNIENENTGINDDLDQNVLEIITIIGCTFSVVGICGIFVTACCFPSWRNKIGTKILIHLSVAILLEIICIQLSEIKNLKHSERLCTILGIFLHYVVLSKFAWTLVYAYLQYYRFVRVIGAIPKYLILKAVIAGWGFPLAIVFIAALVTNESYVSTSYDLCYPRGLLLYLTVLTPIGVIILANLIIFCIVMYNVTYKISADGSKKMFKLRMYLALLLFSVLGIPWIFGIVAELLFDSIFKKILFFVFCVTATLQGFVLFLFYVVLNNETRQFWVKLFQRKKYCSL